MHHQNSLSKKYLAEFVYGATDGTITTFAIITAVSGATLAPVVVLILGFSNVLADGFSMAASNYLSERSNDAVGGVSNDKHPLRSAAVTFFSFVAIGSIPLIPFVGFASIEGVSAFSVSVIATALTFIIIGFVRGYIADENGFRSAFETLLIGSIAAAIAYGAGAWLESLIS